jgi:hypothetical protein
MDIDDDEDKKGIIQKALAIDEPEVGDDYTDIEKKKNLDIIQKALDHASDKNQKVDISVIKDLRDKKAKWIKVKIESKPTKTKTELPVDPTGQTKKPNPAAPPKT